MFTWTEKLKIIIVVLTCFILLVIFGRLFVIFNPIPKIIQKLREFQSKRRMKAYRGEAPNEQVTPMMTFTTNQAPPMNINTHPEHGTPPGVYPTIRPIVPESVLQPTLPQQISPTVSQRAHSHTHCSYVVGRGLVWEDLCPCTSYAPTM